MIIFNLTGLAAARRICSKWLTLWYLLHQAAASPDSPISGFPERVPVASASDGKDDVTLEQTNEFLTSDLLVLEEKRGYASSKF